MAGGLSNFQEAAWLNLTFGGVAYSAPATIYLGLFTTTPTDSTSGTEATGGGYARAAITNNPTNWPTVAAGGTKVNGTTITFPTLSAGIGTINGFAYFDAASGGNMIAWGDLSRPRPYNASDTPRFLPGDLSIALD